MKSLLEEAGRYSASQSGAVNDAPIGAVGARGTVLPHEQAMSPVSNNRVGRASSE
jgi:hypothetical protein